MDISFPMPLLLPFSCTDGAVWGSPTVPVYKRTLQNKDSHVRVKTFLVNSVYLHGRAVKKTSVLKYPHGIVQLEVVSSREGSHGYLDVWWPQEKHLVFKQRLDQKFFIQAKIPLHNSLSKMAAAKVFCMQGTALSKSGS